MKIATGAEMQALDHEAINRFGLPGLALMENAGKGAADVLCARLLVGRSGARVAILCGAGNNGGDGYVIARHLEGRGHRPSVMLLGARERIRGDALTNLVVIERAGIPVESWHDEALSEPDFAARLAALRGQRFDVVVDALLGTGLTSDLRGRYRSVVETLNALEVPVFSVDIPSGLDADTGHPHGVAVHASATASFGLAKPGLLLDPGRTLSGHVTVVDIGFPVAAVAEAQLVGQAIDDDEVVGLLEPRPPHAHKGTWGHVFALAGTPGKTGAAVLTGMGALRAGAGLVTVLTHRDAVSAIAAVAWELMAIGLLEDEPPSAEAVQRLGVVLESASVVAVGPGLGDTPATLSLVHALGSAVECPMVIDADGLNAIARDVSVLRPLRSEVVLTPHPGEMARLCACSTSDVLTDTVSCARAFAEAHGVYVVLKTGATVIAAPDGRYAINTSGTPGMGSAGMGDVLTGIIAGMLAQGLTSWDAARLAVFAHGRAGEEGARVTGQRGLTARVVLDALPPVLADLESRWPETTER